MSGPADVAGSEGSARSRPCQAPRKTALFLVRSARGVVRPLLSCAVLFLLVRSTLLY